MRHFKFRSQFYRTRTFTTFNRLEFFSLILALILAIWEISGASNNWYKQDGNRGTLIKRQRQSVQSFFTKLGAKHAQYYRMEVFSFYYLVELLTQNIQHRKRKRKRGKSPNDDIAVSICVSVALQYFAGGSPLNIALVH